MLFIIVYSLYVHIILKLVIGFAICMLKMFPLWSGLRFEMPIVLRIDNVSLTLYIQGVTGGTDQTSVECSLGHTIPI